MKVDFRQDLGLSGRRGGKQEEGACVFYRCGGGVTDRIPSDPFLPTVEGSLGTTSVVGVFFWAPPFQHCAHCPRRRWDLTSHPPSESPRVGDGCLPGTPGSYEGEVVGLNCLTSEAILSPEPLQQNISLQMTPSGLCSGTGARGVWDTILCLTEPSGHHLGLSCLIC